MKPSSKVLNGGGNQCNGGLLTIGGQYCFFKKGVAEGFCLVRKDSVWIEKNSVVKEFFVCLT